MNTPVPTIADETDAACRRVLTELMEIGMALARRVPDLENVGEAAAAFERVSRAVRRTVRMVRWMDEVRPAARDRVAVRKRVLRAVEDRIDEVAEPEDAAGLHAELLERLDTAELEEDLASRPPAEVIGEICRDLGLERSAERYPSLRRGLAALAALRARAEAAPGATCRVDVPVPVLARGVRVGAGGGGGSGGMSDWEYERLLDDGDGESGIRVGPCLSG